MAALAVAGAAFLPACAAAEDTSAPPRPDASTPSVPTQETSTRSTPPGPTTLPRLPDLVEADATIVKTAPKPPPGVPCDAGSDACVDLSANQAWLLAGADVVSGPVPITTGRPGWETPPGRFNVQWKDIDHLSAEFDDAPMPYSVFFNGGIAFHEGSLSDLSHGCVHLSGSAASAFYDGLAVGDVVQVVP
jgi:lipoprotein-anchoring transpeptidase ErfK/SrfK